MLKANCLCLQEDRDADKSRRHETGWSCKAKQADAQEGEENAALDPYFIQMLISPLELQEIIPVKFVSNIQYSATNKSL